MSYHTFGSFLESASLSVVILTRVRLPTFGSPQTPRKRDHTGRCCCCCCYIVFLQHSSDILISVASVHYYAFVPLAILAALIFLRKFFALIFGSFGQVHQFVTRRLEQYLVFISRNLHLLWSTQTWCAAWVVHDTRSLNFRLAIKRRGNFDCSITEIETNSSNFVHKSHLLQVEASRRRTHSSANS